MSARSIAAFLFKQAAQKWAAEGWLIKIDLVEGHDTVAEFDDETHIVTLRPHGRRDLPIERSLWHEWLHLLFGEEEDEDEVLRLERDTWSVLPVEAKRVLRRMIRAVTDGRNAVDKRARGRQ